MQRIYEDLLQKHFLECSQAAFVCGPRQVGKTTLCKNVLSLRSVNKYLSWDNIDERGVILSGYDKIVQGIGLEKISSQRPMLMLDEIHKYSSWKTYLKGFIDHYKGQLDLLVTGSAKLNIFRKEQDSLMGRYFLYRVHPLSVAELAKVNGDANITNDEFMRLYNFGGFPEPFLSGSEAFYNKWQKRRRELMVYEDIRTTSQIHEVTLLETLAFILADQAGGQVNYSSLAKKVRTSDQTIRRWVDALESFYYCFTLKPYYTNLSRSLVKEPKIYLYDWSLVESGGAKFENFIASHLLKAIHWWTDTGQGDFELYYLRTIDQHEVDFLVTKNRKPWLMVECKTSGQERYSSSMDYFQEKIKATYTMQVVFDMDYVDVDCFQEGKRLIVPARTFLSQLV